MEAEPSLHHVLKRHKRQESRMVNSIYDGNIQTTPMKILRAFTMFIRKKYDAIHIDSDSVYTDVAENEQAHTPRSK